MELCLVIDDCWIMFADKRFLFSFFMLLERLFMLLVKHLATTRWFQTDCQIETEKEIVMTDTWVFAACYCFPCCLKSSSSPVWLPAGKATSLTRMSYLLLVVRRVTSPWKMGVKWHYDFELDVTFPFHFPLPKLILCLLCAVTLKHRCWS